MYHEWGFAVSGENVPKWCGFSYTHLYILFSWKNKPIVNSKERHTTCILSSYFFPASFYLLLLCYPYKYNFKSCFYFWHIFYGGTTWKRNNLQSINKINAEMLLFCSLREIHYIMSLLIVKGAGICSLYHKIHYIEIRYIEVWVYYILNNVKEFLGL